MKFKVGDRVIALMNIGDIAEGESCVVVRVFSGTINGISVDKDIEGVRHMPWQNSYFKLDEKAIHNKKFKAKLNRLLK